MKSLFPLLLIVLLIDVAAQPRPGDIDLRTLRHISAENPSISVRTAVPASDSAAMRDSIFRLATAMANEECYRRFGVRPFPALGAWAKLQLRPEGWCVGCDLTGLPIDGFSVSVAQRSNWVAPRVRVARETPIKKTKAQVKRDREDSLYIMKHIDEILCQPGSSKKPWDSLRAWWTPQRLGDTTYAREFRYWDSVPSTVGPPQ